MKWHEIGIPPTEKVVPGEVSKLKGGSSGENGLKTSGKKAELMTSKAGNWVFILTSICCQHIQDIEEKGNIRSLIGKVNKIRLCESSEKASGRLGGRGK